MVRHDLAMPASMDQQVAGKPLPRASGCWKAATRLFCASASNSVGVDAIVAAARNGEDDLYQCVRLKGPIGGSRARRAATGGPGFSTRSTDRALRGERLDPHRPHAQAVVRREDFFSGCPFINAVASPTRRTTRMRALAIAHKTIVLDRLAALCAEAGSPEPVRMAHALGLVDGRRGRRGAGDPRRFGRRRRRQACHAICSSTDLNGADRTRRAPAHGGDRIPARKNKPSRLQTACI